MRKMHTVSWNFIFSSKDKGGLNLSNIKTKNLAILSKWWWKFHAEKHKNWMQFVLNKYSHEFIYNSEESPKNMSLMFKKIWKCRKEDSVGH